MDKRDDLIVEQDKLIKILNKKVELLEDMVKVLEDRDKIHEEIEMGLKTVIACKDAKIHLFESMGVDQC